jgi:hypothetical protein
VAIDTSKLSFAWKESVGVYMKIALVGTNNGNSPALSASVFASAAVAEFITDPKSLASEACVRPFALWGNITFVKNQIVGTFPFSIPWADITKYQDDIAKYHLTGEDPNAVPFYIIACAQYNRWGREHPSHGARLQFGKVLGCRRKSRWKVSHRRTCARQSPWCFQRRGRRLR